MSINEEAEISVEKAADLLPTGTIDPVVPEADPTSVEPAPEPAVEDTADLLPTGTVDPVVPEADPTSVEPAPEPTVDAAPEVEPSIANEAPVVDEDGLFEEEAEARAPVESPYDRPGRWYVVHTQSGYEKKVRQNLDSRITSMNLEDRIHEVVIPMEDVVEFRNGRKVTVSKKMFPGYLLVRCHLDDTSWAAVRDTPGIVNFVGSGGKPLPLGRREVENLLQAPDEDSPDSPRRTRARFGYEQGETVRVKEGPFADFSGEIIEINEDQLKVKVLVNIFGRETPVELEFSQVAQL
ncbi:MAG: transcription termination/antitermination protein NusG [Actinobacteria bacterium]|nr:transcription termination/antitermination protein NusG [Actinomycetota bacterium]